MPGPELVVLSHLRWTHVWQRPQQLVSRLARRRRTWFVEEPLPADVAVPALACEEAGPVTRVWLEVPAGAPHVDFGEAVAEGYGAALRDLVGASSDRWVWLYTPLAFDLAKSLDPKALVYDVMDDLASFRHASRSMIVSHRLAVASADVVFAGGRSLFEKVRRIRPDRAHLFPSGVETEHYAGARPDRRESERPVAGYVGVIDERIDLRLLESLADLLPHWDIALVGPLSKLEGVDLPERPNITYAGQQPYEDLPRWMAGFDVGLMPFALNASTRSISPTKTLEYLAAGLPVVSTRVPDVVADFGGIVDLQDEARGFARACEQLRQGWGPEVHAKVQRLLRLHHWDAIAARMEELVEGAAHRRGPARRGVDERVDFVVVGAGFAGSVMAERLARGSGKRVLLVDRRSHVGGNAYDHYDEHGILVHRYGPHVFHTNSPHVFAYLSRFTQWRPYEHVVQASVDGRLVPVPINLDTINAIYGLDLAPGEVEAFLASVAEPRPHCRTSEDVVVSRVGRLLYEKLFRNYTRKQWGLDPSELDASVTARVPTRTNRDPRYFTDRFQAMPLHGYTRMFERMLAHPNIEIALGTDYRDVRDHAGGAEVVYTGQVDEFFGFRYGRLPYRSLRFEFETLDTSAGQRAAVINYPNDHAYTRVTEFKRITGQEHPKTTLVREFPSDDGDPYYPVPRPENAALYRRYKSLAAATPGVHFVGRLATYKYYNMDQVTAQALQTYAKLRRAVALGGSPSVTAASSFGDAG